MDELSKPLCCSRRCKGMAAKLPRALVFFSYARRDKMLRDRLEDHLSNLKYRGIIVTWYDREISAGDEWARQIDIYLDQAHIILLLISSDFMASEYCYSIEMKRALERHERGEADVIPILLRPVLYTDAPFAKLQFLPTGGKPVVTWRNRDSAFVDIAFGIQQVVEELHGPKDFNAEDVYPGLMPFPGTPVSPSGYPASGTVRSRSSSKSIN